MGILDQFAAMFAPHQFQTDVKFTGTMPKVMFTWQVYNYLRTLVSIVSGPVSWLGTAVKLSEGVYLISKVFLPTQEVTAGAASIEPEDWVKLTEEITAAHPDEAMAIINQINFWGCATSTNTTAASDKDVKNLFAQSGQPFCILGSFSLQGKIELTLHQFEGAPMSFKDIPWGIAESEDEELVNAITNEVAAKVRKRAYAAYNVHHYTPPAAPAASKPVVLAAKTVAAAAAVTDDEELDDEKIEIEDEDDTDETATTPAATGADSSADENADDETDDPDPDDITGGKPRAIN